MTPHQILRRMVECDYADLDPGHLGTFKAKWQFVVLELVPTSVSSGRYILPPDKVGQRLTLTCQAEGSNTAVCVFRLTPDGSNLAINQAGNTIATLGDNDILELIGVKVDGVLQWRVIGNDGTGLT
jgi:hypothetical protein